MNRRITISISIPEQIVKSVDAEANTLMMSRSLYITALLAKYFDAKEKRMTNGQTDRNA